MNHLITNSAQERLYQYASWLAIFTIVYNLLEGLVSIYFGAQDEALTVFGFGLDSFVDSLGALGLIYYSFQEGRESFEKAAGMS